MVKIVGQLRPRLSSMREIFPGATFDILIARPRSPDALEFPANVR